MSDKSRVYLHGIETAVPRSSYSQEYARDFMRALPVYTDKHKRFIDRIYDRSAIEKRHTVIDDYGKAPGEYRFYPPTADLLPEPSIDKRNDLYIPEANRLSLEAARKLLDGRYGPRAEDITHVVTASCTGFSAPGFDFYLAKTLPLPDTVDRFHIGFMGCYAAFPALKLAHSLCRSDPKATVLVVATELCTLHFQQRLEADFIISNALFADGTGGALVSARQWGTGPRLALEAFSSVVVPDSEEEMTWKVGSVAFDMRLSAYVPKFIGETIRDIVLRLAEELGISLEEIAHWAIHPGGRAILDRAAAALALEPGALEHSYTVLRNYGNMSSATIFFVLKRHLESPGTGPLFASAFGPGLTVESALMTKC